MKNFEKWDKEFRNHNLFAFNNDKNALLWLKVRAVCRAKQIQTFLDKNKLTLSSSKISEQNRELFELLENMSDSMQILDDFLKEKSNEWYQQMAVDEAILKNDLYKIRNYAWGGDQNNSLDKYMISRYVKIIDKYDDLLAKQNEIAINAWNYVQTSWYNNWTSYLIESLFKRHANVVSAVGEIKSVDFFLKDIPIDLKVTYFPNQYMDLKLKDKLGKRELSWLKQKAMKVGVVTDNSQTDAQTLYTLSEKLSELGEIAILEELKSKRKEVVNEAQSNAVELIKWLYENQGEMRFGAENRLFVILVDSTDMSQSWKMKRAFALIEPKVMSYLDNFSDALLKEINFTFKGSSYKALADVIFIIK